MIGLHDVGEVREHFPELVPEDPRARSQLNEMIPYSLKHHVGHGLRIPQKRTLDRGCGMWASGQKRTLALQKFLEGICHLPGLSSARARMPSSRAL